MGDDSRRRTHAKRLVHLILYCDLLLADDDTPCRKKNPMSAELAFNTYVLLGNALNHLVNGVQLDPEAAFDAPAAALVDLYREIEPLSPQQILPALAALPQDQKALLDRCCRYCLSTMGDDKVSTKLGLPRDVAEDVLNQLSLETSHA
jgi:hypothetical protein